MKLKEFDLQHINYWNYEISSNHGEVTDMINLNYGSNNIDLQYKFKRCKSFCYFESMRDYGITFSKSLDFIELFQQLENHAAYCSPKYEREHELTYGID